jgi:hypothetical protein
MEMLISSADLIMLPLSLVLGFLPVFALRRYGLLTMVTLFYVAHLAIFFPITSDFSAWFAYEYGIALAISLTLAAYAAYRSVGGAKALSQQFN